MLLASFPAGPLQANCYFVARETGRECVIIDPGMQAMDGVHAMVAEHDLTPAAVLITHGHFDHMWCAQDIAAEYRVPVWIHPADRHLLSDPLQAISGESSALLRQQWGIEEVPEFREPADVRDAHDGTRIEVDEMVFTVAHVPGHTPGAVVYRLPYSGPEDVTELMFSGDFLFAGSIGRTDLEGGSHPEMLESLRRTVLPADDTVAVLPGHGQQTSIARERATNPFLVDLID